MAQPVNTYDSFDMRGIREDLRDVIYDISPGDTPFLTKCAKVSASNTFHEWQTDAVRSSADNVHIEGDDTTGTARTATTRLGNYTQIFKEAVVVSGTDQGLTKAGRAKEMAYQIRMVAKAVKLDIEKALFANQARSAGVSGVSGRRLAGTGAWLTTNTNFQSGSSGADPTGDGTNARTDDGVPTAFSQTKFDNVMQQIWTSGGKPDTVYLSAFQMQVAQGFTGNNSQQANVDATKKTVIKYMAMYVTPWGTVEFMPSRENRSRDVYIMQDDMWSVAELRPMRNEELAKTGDSEKRQLVTELTLCAQNEKASGGIFDNTTV